MGRRMNQMTRLGTRQHPLLTLRNLVVFAAILCSIGMKNDATVLQVHMIALYPVVVCGLFRGHFPHRIPTPVRG